MPVIKSLDPYVPLVFSETEYWISFFLGLGVGFFQVFLNYFCFIHSRACPVVLHIAGLSKISKGLRLLYATGQSSFCHFSIKYHLWSELFCINLFFWQKPILYLFLWRKLMFSVGLHYSMDIIWFNFDP